jgi:hypothetical protein
MTLTGLPLDRDKGVLLWRESKIGGEELGPRGKIHA